MRIVLPLLMTMPAAVFAAGGESTTAPATTPTTQQCTNGLVWDKATGACVAPKDSRLNDDTLMDAVREFAHAGQFQDASRALDAMQDQNSDFVLTYRGFTERKLGNLDLARKYYGAALNANPNNFMARSYLGQSYVELGQTTLARAELSEIRTRGGRGTWAEISLRMAIQSGQGYSY